MLREAVLLTVYYDAVASVPASGAAGLLELVRRLTVQRPARHPGLQRPRFPTHLRLAPGRADPIRVDR